MLGATRPVKFGAAVTGGGGGGDAITIEDYSTNLTALTGGTGNVEDTFAGPSGAQSGDLLLWVGVGRGNNTDDAIPASGTGGQTWTQLQNTNANPRQLNISYAVFNGTFTGNLACASPTTATGSMFVFALRSTSGTTWNIETLTGPSGIGSTSSYSIKSGTPSGDPAIVFAIAQNAALRSYSNTTANGFASVFASTDYFDNSLFGDNSGVIWYEYQDTAAASGDVDFTITGGSYAYTRTQIAVYRS